VTSRIIDMAGIALFACGCIVHAIAGQSEATVFKLHLRAKSDLTFDAKLVNTTSAARWALIDANVQPLRPTLWRRDGSEIDIEDGRATAKFDNATYRHLFSRVPAHGSIAAGDGAFHATADRTFIFRWGTFVTAPLPADCYRLFVSWRSAVSGWTDESGRWVHRSDLWLGMLRSNVRTVCLS
jgi:hypothetical protein